MDDTAEFYLYEDAQQALSLNKNNAWRDSFNTEFRQVYWQLEQLPPPIIHLLDSQPIGLNIPLLLQTPRQDIYLLAFQEAVEDPVIYVVHRFDKSQSLDFFPLFILFGLLAFFAIFVVMVWVIKGIKSQANILSSQLQTISPASPERSDALFINEFNQIISSVRGYYNAQQQAINREREVSNYLSHELRQPLAKLSINLSLMDQLDDLPYESITVLEQLKMVNQELHQLSESILQLWQDSRETTEVIDLNSVVTKIIGKLSPTALKINYKVSSSPVRLETNPSLATLAINQLIRNSHQYADSYITVEITKRHLVINNDIKNVLPQTIAFKQFGYGMGLVMVRKICEVVRWRIDVQQQQHIYTIKISF